MSNRLAVIQADESVKELQEIENALKSIIPLYKETVKEINRINRALKTGNLREYRDAMRDLRNETSQFVNIERQLADAMARVARLELQQARTATEQARTRRELASALREESRARQQTAREAAANSRQARQDTSAHAQLTRQVREARQRARDYGAEIVNLNNRMRSGEITRNQFRNQMNGLERDFRTSTNEAIRLERQLRQLNQVTLPSGQRNGALWGRVTDIVKGVGIVNVLQNVASGFYNLGEKALQTARKLDTLRLAQLSVFKTNEEVNKQNLYLSGIAERYGIEIVSLTDSYTKFAASAEGTYLEGNRTQQIFDAVTRSSALLGVSTDDTTGILKALGQMMSKGKVQAEELRGQLGDRMAGAFKLFADGMGISTAQLDKMLKDGEVLADDVLPKFAEQLNKKYELGIGDDIETQNAGINRLSNSWTEFVKGIESGSGLISKSVIGVTNGLSNMLKALTPSAKVTIIEQEQAQLNMLGIELRKNFEDEKKRKDILDQIIAINPFFLEGLDKENLSLAEIGKQIQNVNQQYIQKIALEKQQEKIKELVDDQAQAYIYLSKVYSDNAVAYNNFNEKTKKAIDDFRDGLISYDEATNQVRKSTKDFTKENTTSLEMLYRLNTVINQSSFNIDGYNRGVKGNEAAIKDASREYNYLVDFTNKLIGAQGQLVHMNGLVATSFNDVGRAAMDRRKEAVEIIRAAENMGQKYALVRNVWRKVDESSQTWRTTNKKGDDWFLEDGILKQRQKTKILEKDLKDRASKLSGVQKDYLKDLQAIRDLELAINETKYVKGEQDEKNYLENILRINTSFYNKKINFLKGKNAEERKQRADAILDQAKLEKETAKKIFDIEAKINEEQNKIKINQLERNFKQIEENQYINDVERLHQQINNDDLIISELYTHYENQIELAKKFNQDTLEIERKRDADIGKVQDERLKRINLFPEALNKEVEYQSSLLQFNKDISYEKQRQIILSDRKLNVEQRDFLLSQLEKENQIKSNNLEIQKLNSLKGQILARIELSKLNGGLGIPTPEELQRLHEYEAAIKRLEGDNVQLDVDLGSALSPEMIKLKEIISQGLSNLGLENLANQFDAVFQKIVDGTMSAKDAALLAASAIGDGLTAINNRTKENTIAALDEQLKYTQETTEQEIGFINGRLEQLNALETLTEEQMSERNRLEDEARTYKEQQLQREKMIEAQKAKAEQKAAANQALINGALAATMTLAQLGFIAGAVPAGLALAFGLAQSLSIMSKDPVPKYFVGRRGGKAEIAITQDGGRELITDKKGNIKSLGSDKGDQLTWLDAGDTVHTAKETKSILKRMVTMPNLGDNIYRKIALQNMIAPQLTISKNEIDYDKLADKIGSKFENSLKRYTHPTVEKIEGKIIRYRGANFAETIGYYDIKTEKEISYDEFIKKNSDGTN